MRLFNIAGVQRVLIADIRKNNTVVYLHPSIKESIDKEKGVAIPALNNLRDQFDGNRRIASNHPKFGKAVMIYLDMEVVSRAPSKYQWVDDPLVEE